MLNFLNSTANQMSESYLYSILNCLSNNNTVIKTTNNYLTSTRTMIWWCAKRLTNEKFNLLIHYFFIYSPKVCVPMPNIIPHLRAVPVSKADTQNFAIRTSNLARETQIMTSIILKKEQVLPLKRQPWLVLFNILMSHLI